MLDRKGIPFKRVDLIPGRVEGVLRAMGFPGVTVPALKLDGRKIQGSREIARELDRSSPSRRSSPPTRSAGKVEEAEAWGDEFQQKPRRMSWWAFRRDRSPMASYSEGARLGVPVGLGGQDRRRRWSRSPRRLNGSTDENVRADLASLGRISTGSMADR